MLSSVNKLKTMTTATTTKTLVKVHHVIVVGDGAVGKTCLLHRFHNRSMPHDYVATVYDQSEFEVYVDDEPHMVQLHDTAGQEEYERLRRVFYPMADAFLLCFSVDNRDSLLSARTQWIKELKDFRTGGKRAPVVLCATKIDLRSGRNDCVTSREAESVRLAIGASSLVECSAMTNVGVKSAIYEAVRASVLGLPQDEDTSGRWGCLCCVRWWRSKLCFNCFNNNCRWRRE